MVDGRRHRTAVGFRALKMANFRFLFSRRILITPLLLITTPTCWCWPSTAFHHLDTDVCVNSVRRAEVGGRGATDMDVEDHDGAAGNNVARP